MLIYIAIILTLILLFLMRMNWIITLNQKTGFELLIEAIKEQGKTK